MGHRYRAANRSSLQHFPGHAPRRQDAGRKERKTPRGGREFALRGHRAAREIKYSDWRKFCFKTPGTNMVRRTSITGTFETAQPAVRIDLTEREGDKAARL